MLWRTFVQGPSALLRKCPLQLLPLLCNASRVSRLVAWRPKYCAARVPIRVRALTLAAMIAAVTSGLMSGIYYRPPRQHQRSCLTASTVTIHVAAEVITMVS